MGIKVGELFVALGFDVDETKLKSFNDGIKSARNDLIKLSAVAAGTLYAVNKFVSGSVAAATSLRNFNTETGHSIENLQKWQIAAQLTNSAISADQVTGSFRAMAQAIADVSMGKGNAGAFAMLGISDVRGMDVAQVLEQLRKNFDKNVREWGYKQTIDLMSDVGFDPAMINALRLTNDQFEKLSQNRFLSPEQLDKLVKLGDAMTNLRLNLSLFKDEISAEIAPSLIGIIDGAIPIIKSFKTELFATVGAYKDLWDSLDSEDQKTILYTAAALLVAFNPVLAVLSGIVWAIHDIGKGLRGLNDSKIFQFFQYAADLQHYAANELRETLKGKYAHPWIRDNIFGYRSPEQEAMTQGLMNYRPAGAVPEYLRSATFNNTYNINSTADAESIADIILENQERNMRRMLNSSAADQGHGGRY